MYSRERPLQSRGSDEATITMACPLCGDRCTCSYAPSGARVSAPSSLTYEPDEYCDLDPQKTVSREEEAETGILASATAEAAEESFAERSPLPPEDLALEPQRAEEELGAMWKEEVSSRLESYRARRGSRRPRYNATMSLDFDRAANRMMASAYAQEEAAWERALAEPAAASPAREERNEYFGAATQQEAAPEGAPVEQPPATNLIEFPRLPTLFDMAPSGSEIAEPVVDKPRILYVPEEVPTAQAPHADIQLEPEERPQIPDLELPMAVAPMSQRVLAAVADAFLVVIGSGVFLAIAQYQVPAPEGKLGYALVAMLPAALWAIYEYLFLVHCARTPGMQLAHLTLASFDAEPIGRRQRRERALAWMLSTFPLGLGLIWALLDEDTLCWHDRITRTYVTGATSQE